MLKFDSLLTGTLVICAIVTTALVIHREATTSSTDSLRQASEKPIFISDWRSKLGQGIQLGSVAAPVQLIEFSDFECPYCASFHTTLKIIRERYRAQVALTYVHFPLPAHRFAAVAARVAECAGDQGRFEAMHDQLFENQDSFGLRPWSEYGRAALVADLPAFNLCVGRADTVRRIEEGKRLGTQLEIKATPTLIVNGWMLGRPPSVKELDAMVQAILAGRSPMTAIHQS